MKYDYKKVYIKSLTIFHIMMCDETNYSINKLPTCSVFACKLYLPKRYTYDINHISVPAASLHEIWVYLLLRK